MTNQVVTTLPHKHLVKATFLRRYRPSVQAGVTERAVKTIPWLSSATGAVFALAGGVYTLGLFPLIAGCGWLVSQPLKPLAKAWDTWAGRGLESFQARAFVKHGSLWPGYRPTAGLIGYRFIQEHLPHLTALGVGQYTANLGYEMAQNTGATREMERLGVGATTGVLGGLGGWHLGKYLRKQAKVLMCHVLR